MAIRSSTASSATSGFVQSLPVIPPQYISTEHRKLGAAQSVSDDTGLESVLALYLPKPLPAKVAASLHNAAEISLDPKTLRLLADAESNAPTLHSFTTFGKVNDVDALRTGEGWRGLKDIGVRLGSVGVAYAQPNEDSNCSWNRRVHQCAISHLWSGSAALVTCPAAMTDGAAVLLGRHLQDSDGDQPGRGAALREARSRLISFDPSYAWSSGQWMTERSGGSDVSETESMATRLSVTQLAFEQQQFGNDKDNTGMSLGPWKIDGFKWFSSATDADMVVLLARTSKGISTFFAPMRRVKNDQIVMNGVRITRLKQKLGTRALPTSELEIQGMRAWLIGEEGKGIKEISAILNLTRIGTASGAVASWARGLAIARAFSRVRKVRGSLLQDNPQHVRWMANETVKYRASLYFAFLGAALSGLIEQGMEAIGNAAAARFLAIDKTEAELLLRILTPVMKAQCSLAAVHGVRECMESLGGVGYCESDGDGVALNVARIFRDVNVNPIWEGTVSVMVEDFVRAAKGRLGTQTLSTVDRLVNRIIDCCQAKFDAECNLILSHWTQILSKVRHSDTSSLVYDGREVLTSVESVLCACLLLFDSVHSNDDTSIVVARVWLTMKFHGAKDLTTSRVNELKHQIDREIFLGKATETRAPQARI